MESTLVDLQMTCKAGLDFDMVARMETINKLCSMIQNLRLTQLSTFHIPKSKDSYKTK